MPLHPNYRLAVRKQTVGKRVMYEVTIFSADRKMLIETLPVLFRSKIEAKEAGEKKVDTYIIK